MADERNQVEESRKQFLEEFMKIKFLIESVGYSKKLNDKAGLISSIRRIIGL